MKIIDNINSLLGGNLKASIHSKAKLKIAALCFSIYAYEALKSELARIEPVEFIFTAPTFGGRSLLSGPGCHRLGKHPGAH